MLIRQGRKKASTLFLVGEASGTNCQFLLCKKTVLYPGVFYGHVSGVDQVNNKNEQSKFSEAARYSAEIQVRLRPSR